MKTKQESLTEERGPWYSLDVEVWSNAQHPAWAPGAPGFRGLGNQQLPRCSVPAGWAAPAPSPACRSHHPPPLCPGRDAASPPQGPGSPAKETRVTAAPSRTPPKAKWHGRATTAAWHPNSTQKSDKSSFWTSYTVLLFGIVEPVCDRS